MQLLVGLSISLLLYFPRAYDLGHCEGEMAQLEIQNILEEMPRTPTLITPRSGGAAPPAKCQRPRSWRRSWRTTSRRRVDHGARRRTTCAWLALTVPHYHPPTPMPLAVYVHAAGKKVLRQATGPKIQSRHENAGVKKQLTWALRTTADRRSMLRPRHGPAW